MYEPNWTANTVTSSVDGPLSIFSNDLDGDGDIDVFLETALYKKKGKK